MRTNITKVQELFYELYVRDVMVRDVITVTPQTTMAELKEILRIHRISGVPVVEQEKLVGMISLANLIRALEAGALDQAVGAHMTKKIDVLHASERVVEAIRKFEETQYGRFPVVSQSKTALVGILTLGDIIRGTLKQLDIDYRKQESREYPTRHFFQDVYSQDTSIILRYQIQPLDFVHGGEAASYIKRALKRLGISPGILRRVAIATYEAEMNLVLHTNHGGQIQAHIHPDILRIDVTDDGPGIPDIEQAMRPGFSTASPRIREMGFGAGMGLSNIQKCVDEMTLESQVGNGTQLTLGFQLKERSTSDNDDAINQDTRHR